MTTKLLIYRELLEQVASEFEHDNDRYMLGRELRKVLAAPQPSAVPESQSPMRRGDRSDLKAEKAGCKSAACKTKKE